MLIAAIGTTVLPGAPATALPAATAAVAPAAPVTEQLPGALAVARMSTGGNDATTATITLATLLLATGLACIGGSRRRTRTPRAPRRRI